VAVIGLNAIGQIVLIPAYPFWSLMIIAVDVMALWGTMRLRKPREHDRLAASFVPGLSGVVASTGRRGMSHTDAACPPGTLPSSPRTG
jgi:hypothetical protein